MTGDLGSLTTALSDRYRIERELGAGGMATVYLAHDVKHERRVAVKVLKPDLAAVIGAARFLSEIRTTANLQHPHILPLHDSGEVDGTVFYVMPYVEGESLRDRLVRETQLPVADAVRIAREVADALQYAHERGVIHRDIKPENILLQGGHALVADFGIALAASKTGGTRLTETGMSLGTPTYMSPEQAMGDRALDARSDVYALGCVLYEMLVGEPPFTGPTPQAIVAKVLTERPARPAAIRDTVPPNVEAAVLRALAKLPADRFGSAAEFAAALATESVAATAGQAVAVVRARLTPRLWRVVPWMAAVAATLALVVSRANPSAHAPEPARLSISLDGGFLDPTAATWRVAISPDGRRLAYVSGSRVLAREVTDGAFRLVPGAQSAIAVAFNGDSITFWRQQGVSGPLLQVGREGEAPRELALMPGGPGPMNTAAGMVTMLNDGSLAIVRKGLADTVAKPGDGEWGLWATGSLPDGRLLSSAVTGAFQPLSLDVVDATGGRTRLVDGPIAFATYADGMLLTVTSGGEMAAAALDPSTLRRGSAVVLDTVASTVMQLPVIAADTLGSVVYFRGSSSVELVIVDRSGKRTLLAVDREMHRPRLSPDARRLLVDVTERGERDVWALNLADPTLDRVTHAGTGHDATWLPDGRSFLYLVNGEQGTVGTLRHELGSGRAGDTVAWQPGNMVQVHDVTPDGRAGIAVAASATTPLPGFANTTAGRYDLAEVALDGSRRVTVLEQTKARESYPAMSPDGRWLAYVSDESGQNEVYLRPYGRQGARIKISLNGGTEPVWRRSGSVLYFRAADLRNPMLVEATLSLGNAPRVTARTELFSVAEYQTADPHPNYDVLPDGRFVMLRQPGINTLSVIQNWPELARRMLRAARMQ